MKLGLCLMLVCALAACSDTIDDQHNASLENLRGKWVLVNYWAQWCKPCIEEIPELNAFAAERTDVAVLGVNFEGTTGPELESQESALGIAFPTVEDPAAKLGIARPAVLPTTLVVDPTGAVVNQLHGPQTAATLAAAIAAAGNTTPGD